MAGVTGFASIAFGYPHALWGQPQTPECVALRVNLQMNYKKHSDLLISSQSVFYKHIFLNKK